MVRVLFINFFLQQNRYAMRAVYKSTQPTAPSRLQHFEHGFCACLIGRFHLVRVEIFFF